MLIAYFIFLGHNKADSVTIFNAKMKIKTI